MKFKGLATEDTQLIIDVLKERLQNTRNRLQMITRGQCVGVSPSKTLKEAIELRSVVSQLDRVVNDLSESSQRELVAYYDPAHVPNKKRRIEDLFCMWDRGDFLFKMFPPKNTLLEELEKMMLNVKSYSTPSANETKKVHDLPFKVDINIGYDERTIVSAPTAKALDEQIEKVKKEAPTQEFIEWKFYVGVLIPISTKFTP